MAIAELISAVLVEGKDKDDDILFLKLKRELMRKRNNQMSSFFKSIF